MADKAFYSTIEASKLLGVSVRTVQLWVESGSLDAWKTAGGHRRIVAKSVNDYINDNQATPSVGSQSIRVLVVEDNATVSKFYEAAIHSWGHSIEVVTKKNGFESLLEIGRQVPDLLISDIYMPGMDGLQMIRSLYKSELLSADKIIIISGLSEENITERGGIPLGIDFFIKPVDVMQLKRAVFSKLSIALD